MTARKVNSKPRSTDASPSGSGGARYRRLPTGAHGLTREEVERDQRERLRSAMVELIAQRGYPAVRILDLTQLAHVSRPTFYNLYSEKEELLLSAYEDIAGRTTQKVAEAFAQGDTDEDSLRRGLEAFAELGAAEPEAMTLALLGTFGAGPRALERRDRTLHALERIVSSGRSLSADGELPRDLTVKFLIGGIREASATRLRQGRTQELVELAGELGQWANSYPSELPLGLEGTLRIRRRDGNGDGNAAARDDGDGSGAGTGTGGNGEGSSAQSSPRSRRAEGRLPSGRHDLPRDQVIKSQRERIVDATAAIVAEKGFAGLTIPEIASRANVSHETFYEMYPTKHAAFLGAQKVGLHQALRVTRDAYEAHADAWHGGVAAGMHALMEYVCSEPSHAHLTLVDTFGASPEAIEIRESALQAFTAYLQPGFEHAPAHVDVPDVAAEAVAGGIWQVLHHYIEQNRMDELCDAAPQLIFLTLNPFLGPELAADTARQPVS
ncbi:MAG TPA: TetR/AcrR family transcriptional regulator [Solirubrobacteraceae bacterium]|jgi:AcrR family transcriptional regulator|nr:TetR/AcrR family transcriptional regulator [Solirubrobacteraceae bacterium]